MSKYIIIYIVIGFIVTTICDYVEYKLWYSSKEDINKYISDDLSIVLMIIIWAFWPLMLVGIVIFCALPRILLSPLKFLDKIFGGKNNE